MDNQFREIWMVDFEFYNRPGDRQVPVCMVAKEYISGLQYRMWRDELIELKKPPYSLDKDSLFVAYYASAEFGCHLTLNWPLPEKVLDLYTEFRNLTNGIPVGRSDGLIGAMNHFGLNGIDAFNKDIMHDLVMRGEPWNDEEKEMILDCCEADVDSLRKLLIKMWNKLDLPRAILRGEFMKAVADIEYNGIPIDTEWLGRFRKYWKIVYEKLIKRIDDKFDVFDGLTFKHEKFARWLKSNEIPWPRTNTGRIALSDAAFKEMSHIYPEVSPLRKLRATLVQMRYSKLTVGEDGRNRCLLSAFQARTGRNQPSTSKFIFGQPTWLRGLIKPDPGSGLAIIDWEQQEFGIAAALSKDNRMMDAYKTGDPYLAFAKQAGVVPHDGTNITHSIERTQFKECALAVLYGMGTKSLAKRINQPIEKAEELLRFHKTTYTTFWKWSDAVVDYAMINSNLYTTFGWTVHIGEYVNPRFLRNFPMQANGAEMLRLACCDVLKRGGMICAPIHDAIMIEASLDELDTAIATTQRSMADASAIVLEGFKLRTDVYVVKYPGRYMDQRGKELWDIVDDILSNLP